MKKLFISQPMKDKTPEQILDEREFAIACAEQVTGEKLELIDSYFGDEIFAKNNALFCLGKSLELLAEADVAYFAHGWEKARGCRIEHECATEYDVDVIIEAKED